MSTNTLSQPGQQIRLSRWQIATLIFMLGAVGVSAYLAYVEGFGVSVACPPDPRFDCGTVQNSVYSKVAGIHVAWLGLAFNLAIVGSILFAKRLGMNGPIITTGLLFFGVLFSIWLIYVQAALLSAFCIWCLVHEVFIFLAFAASLPTLVTHLREEGI